MLDINTVPVKDLIPIHVEGKLILDKLRALLFTLPEHKGLIEANIKGVEDQLSAIRRRLEVEDPGELEIMDEELEEYHKQVIEDLKMQVAAFSVSDAIFH